MRLIVSDLADFLARNLEDRDALRLGLLGRGNAEGPFTNDALSWAYSNAAARLQ